MERCKYWWGLTLCHKHAFVLCTICQFPRNADHRLHAARRAAQITGETKHTRKCITKAIVCLFYAHRAAGVPLDRSNGKALKLARSWPLHELQWILENIICIRIDSNGKELQMHTGIRKSDSTVECKRKKCIFHSFCPYLCNSKEFL
jgi:hypothetical protein